MFCRELFQSKNLKSFIGDLTEPSLPVFDSDERLNKWIFNNAIDGHHVCGTCKMGGDSMSVVNQKGFVYGIATILMMAEKLAHSM